MSMLKDFRAFAIKGNVVDLAVGVIIGGAFGKIVSSLVEDIIMPIVGKIFGGLDFSNYFIPLVGQTATTLAEARIAPFPPGRQSSLLMEHGRPPETPAAVVVRDRRRSRPRWATATASSAKARSRMPGLAHKHVRNWPARSCASGWRSPACRPTSCAWT